MTKMVGRLAAMLLLAAAGSAAAEPRLETVATLTDKPANFEGIDLGRDGSLYVTSNFDNAIHRFSPDGKPMGDIALPVHAQVDLLLPDGGLVVTGHARLPTFGPRGPSGPMTGLGTALVVVDSKGKVSRTILGPDDAFFNGIDRMGFNRFVIADTIGGRLWLADIVEGTIVPWLTDVSVEGPNGRGAFGGANGIKVHGGWVYYTSRGSMWREKIGKGGAAEGKPVEFAKQGGDDFDITADGTIYIPGGPALMKISPKGEISKVIDVGANSPTARLAKDGKSVFLINRGPPPGSTTGQPMHLIRVWF